MSKHYELYLTLQQNTYSNFISSHSSIKYRREIYNFKFSLDTLVKRCTLNAAIINTLLLIKALNVKGVTCIDKLKDNYHLIQQLASVLLNVLVSFSILLCFYGQNIPVCFNIPTLIKAVSVSKRHLFSTTTSKTALQH